MSFRFDKLSRLTQSKMAVTIPPDSQGYLARECPNDDCLGIFKIKPGTGLQGEDLQCHCAYCGTTQAHDHFWTKEQIEYAKSVALRKIAEAFREDLKQLEFDQKPRGAFGIGFSMKLKPGKPIPLHQMREPTLETHLTCDECSLDYAVFGVFAFCPDCRAHNSLQVFSANLALVEKQLAMAEGLEDAELAEQLVQDALENCVSTFDGYGRELMRVNADRSTEPEKCLKVSFQNLRRADELVGKYFSIGLSELVSEAEWDLIRISFLRRHVLAHRAGVIDAKYLAESGDDPRLLGRRLSITAEYVREVAAALDSLAESLQLELKGA